MAMQVYTNPGISFDPSSFEPTRIMPVRHTLMGHPLLEFGSLVDLARRLDRVGGVRAHSDNASPDTSFVNAPDTHPIRLSVEDTIRKIESANAWMALHNIQNDAVYRKLVDEVLDYVRPMVEPKDPGMCHRAAWIFVTSPNAITPFHIDHEHNFILQVLGRKAIHVFDPFDRKVVSEEALELFHAKVSRQLVTFDDEKQKRATVFDAGPGMGAYMPSTAGHWVKNGDNVSITVSFTYYTRSTMRQKAAHQANYELRRLGVTPSPVGRNAIVDTVKAAASRARHALVRAVKRAPSHPSILAGEYAIGN
jgi:hypothetical protein